LENTIDLIKLSGFNLHYDNNDISHNHVKMNIDDCGITKKDKILEIGCGAGRLGKIFLENNYNYFGLERSSSLVDKFKKINGDKINIINNNKIPFENNTFDVVFCYSVIQYLEDEETFTSFLNEMLRVSKKMVCIYDLETIDSTKNMVNNYNDNDNLKHLCIQKDYFKSTKGVLFNNLNVSKTTRYNVIINITDK